LAVALQLLDEQGAEALTMRRLAEALSSGTATLYRHFASREDLVAQVVDQVFAEMREGTSCALPGGGAQEWQKACRGLAHHMFLVLGRHPGAARLLVDVPPMGPNAMKQREHSLAILLANGFEPRMAAKTYATLARYVLGFAMQLSSTLGEDQHLFVGLDAARLPATHALASVLPVSLEEEFLFGLELMLEGLGVLRAGPDPDAPHDPSPR